MSRRAGVTPEETRRRLLDATIRLLVERGFEGVRVSEVAMEAGVSTGAIYSQFASKAELLGAAISEQAPAVIAEHVASGGEGSVLELFRAVGLDLPERGSRMGPLLLELILSVTRDPDLAALVGGRFAANESMAVQAIRMAQAKGEVDAALDAGAVGRLISMVALGSLATATLGFDPVDSDAWDAVVTRMVDAARPPGAGRRAGGGC